MSDTVELPVEWDDDDGSVTIGHPIPDSPAVAQVHWIDPDLTIDSDGVDPERFGQVRATAEGAGTVERSRTIGALLGLGPAALDIGARGSLASVSVSTERLRLLGRAAAVGASVESAASLGDPSPWWTADVHVLERLLGRSGDALPVPLNIEAAPLTAAAVEQILGGSWLDLGGVADAAAAEVTLMAGAARVAAEDLTIASERERVPSTEGIEPGMVPVLQPGQRVQVPVVGLDVRPQTLDLRRGVEVALDAATGTLTVTASIADGAYHPDARAHRVVVRRRDSDVIIAEAPMEVAGTEHVAATVRLSRYSLGHALAIRLVDDRSTVRPDRQLAEIRAGRSLALAGASLARLGHVAAAEDLFGRSAQVWRNLGQEDRALAAQGAAVRASMVTPFFAESLIAAGTT